jgi:hypothetical protein
MLKAKVLLVAAALLASVAAAQAQITLTFYSHAMNTHGMDLNFPHGYITLTGTISNGVPVNTNFGWTPPAVTPGILFGHIDGEVEVADSAYVAEGTPHFSLPITDQQYGDVLKLVATWRAYPQPSYDLDDRNCVTFVKAVAMTVGLKVTDDGKFNRKPSEFLDQVAALNATALAGTKTAGVVHKPAAAVAGASN